MMHMQITQADFDSKLKALSEKNWKVKKLLDELGGFDKLPKHLKELVDKQLGIVRKESIYVIVNDDAPRHEN